MTPLFRVRKSDSPETETLSAVEVIANYRRLQRIQRIRNSFLFAGIISAGVALYFMGGCR